MTALDNWKTRQSIALNVEPYCETQKAFYMPTPSKIRPCTLLRKTVSGVCVVRPSGQSRGEVHISPEQLLMPHQVENVGGSKFKVWTAKND